MSERRATISAWQSFRARPLSLMYSPFMHLVPVDTQMTSASFTSAPGREKPDVNAMVSSEIIQRRVLAQGTLVTPTTSREGAMASPSSSRLACGFQNHISVGDSKFVH